LIDPCVLLVPRGTQPLDGRASLAASLGRIVGIASRFDRRASPRTGVGRRVLRIAA